MSSVYIETSIVSYLRQRPSGQVVAAARQLLTRRWWDEHRREFNLVTSPYVIDEASQGDSALAAERLESLADVPLLELNSEIIQIGTEIIARAVLPPLAELDALHIATASYHAIDYLLTWNCRHIANAQILPRVRYVLNDLGQFVPVICTPEQMIGEEEDSYD